MLEAIILGAVQGLTEFLPVSSTSHLILFPWFFGWSGDVNTLTFDVAMHTGTLISLLACFWRDWIKLVTQKTRILWFIVLSTIPAGLAGFLLNDIAEKNLRAPILIAFMLAAFGVVMIVSERFRKEKDIDSISLKDALVIGFAQAVALIPGVSRSGITISAGLFMGMKREESARFSFLLSTPIITGASLLHMKELITTQGGYDLQLFSAGIITSFITGVIAIKFLLSFFKRYPLNIFVYYRFALALVIIIGVWIKG